VGLDFPAFTIPCSHGCPQSLSRLSIPVNLFPLPPSTFYPVMAPLKGTRDVVEGIRHNSYDAIIVGGGLAGLVIANRLSEDVNKRVLVLEAGANHMGDPRIDTPGLMATLWEDPEYDWGFWCEPQARKAHSHRLV
jgi:hypothetical protein